MSVRWAHAISWNKPASRFLNFVPWTVVTFQMYTGNHVNNLRGLLNLQLWYCLVAYWSGHNKLNAVGGECLEMPLSTVWCQTLESVNLQWQEWSIFGTLFHNNNLVCISTGILETTFARSADLTAQVASVTHMPKYDIANTPYIKYVIWSTV